ncbi:MAG: hypothetical protein AAB664_00605 [Patescibacteria group bacterium]
MQESKNTNAMHWILGAALLLIGLFVVIALVNVKSQADTTINTVSITNESPTVTNVYLSSTSSPTTTSSATITLNTGTTTTLYVGGAVADNNGYQNISSVTAQIRRSGVSLPTCISTSSYLDCYNSVSCSLSTGSGLTKNYNCIFTVQWNADSTDATSAYSSQYWTADVTVTDGGSKTGSLSCSDCANGTFGEFITTNALATLQSTIGYGTRTLGQPTGTATNVSYPLTQNGNGTTTIQVSYNSNTTVMACDTGSGFPKGNQYWQVTNANSGTALTTTATSVTTKVLRTLTTAGTLVTTTATVYWNVETPANEVGGTCTGTATVSSYAAT